MAYKPFMASVICGIGSGVAFLLFLFVFQTTLPVAVAAGMGSLAGMLMLAKTNRRATLRGTDTPLENLTKTIAMGREKLGRIQLYSLRIDDTKTRNKVEGICVVANKIFEDLQKRPKDVKLARKFFSYYLDATANIIVKYVEISEQRHVTPEIQETLKKVEAVLDAIRSAFEQQLDKLMEGDVLDLDTEIALLENTIKLEGLK